VIILKHAKAKTKHPFFTFAIQKSHNFDQKNIYLNTKKRFVDSNKKTFVFVGALNFEGQLKGFGMGLKTNFPQRRCGK
jgi:hypothetical protein